MVNYKWKRIPGMLQTEAGRKRLWNNLLYRLRSVVIPVARFYRRTLIRRVKIIAVVGSFGKTTTTRSIAAALGFVPEKNDGYNLSVFLAARLLSIKPWERYQVIETGITKKGQMMNNAKLLRPDIVAVTGIGTEHITSLKDLEQTREEKAMMVRALPANGLLVLNGDDPHVLKMRDHTTAKTVTHGYGIDNDYQARFIGTDLTEGTVFSVRAGDKDYEFKTGLFGWGAAYSLMAALIIAEHLEVDPLTAIKRLEKLQPALERLELIKTSSGSFLLVDTYKSAIETFDLAFDTLTELPAVRKIVITGEVSEPQGNKGALYRKLGNRIAETAEHLIFIGSRKEKQSLFSGARSKGMPDENLHYVRHSVKIAGELAHQLIKKGDLVLIKGQTTQKLQRIALALQGIPVNCYKEMCPIRIPCSKCKGQFR